MFIKNTDMSPAQYTTSRQKKIIELVEKNIFKIIISANIPTNIQIFNSYFVNKIKHTNTNKAYEKSRLVI